MRKRYMIDQKLTTTELAERWGVTERHLINMRSQGKSIPYMKLRGKVFYMLKDVEEAEQPERIDA